MGKKSREGALKLDIGKKYYTTEKHHQVFFLADSDYSSGFEYLSTLESLSFPVLMKFTMKPVREGAWSAVLGKYIADRKSEIRFSKSMGDSEREKLKRQIRELEIMASRVGTKKSSLVNLRVSFRVSSGHPVKLRESSATFTSIMKLMGFFVKPIEYMTSGRLREILSPLDNVGSDYLIDTKAASSILPISFTPVPDSRGIALGVDDLTEKPVFIDIFNKDSHNVLIFGETGSGKSFFAKVLLMRFAASSHVESVTLLDPLDEYNCSMFPGKCRIVEVDPGSASGNFGPPGEDGELQEERNSGVTSVVIYKVRNLLEETTSRAIERLLARIYDHMVESNAGRKTILIDEAHLVLSNRNSLEILSRLIRHSRHYRTSVISVTQNLDDLSRNHLSNVIAENSSSLFIFRSKAISNSDRVRYGLESFDDMHTEELLGGSTSPYSECLLIEGGKLRKVRILSTKLESEIIENSK